MGRISSLVGRTGLVVRFNRIRLNRIRLNRLKNIRLNRLNRLKSIRLNRLIRTRFKLEELNRFKKLKAPILMIFLSKV